VLGRKAFEGGGNDFAGTAPSCVKVNDEEGGLFQFVKLREGFDLLHLCGL